MGGNRARLLENAQKHLSKGNLERAIKELQKLIAEEPKDFATRLKLGGLMARAKKIPEAIEQYSLVAQSYLGTDLERRAIPVYELMLQFDGSIIEARMGLARLYQKLGQTRDALEQYGLVAERHRTEGRKKEQLDVLKLMQAVDPDDPEVRRRMGELRSGGAPPLPIGMGGSAEMVILERETDRARRSEDPEALAKALEKMLPLALAKVDILLELAAIYLDQGNARRALRRLNVCYSEAPTDLRVLDLLAAVFQALGSHDKAQSVLRERAKISR